MIHVLDLKPGATLKLRESIVAKVVENMGDGMWVQVEYLEVPGNASEVGALELCHAQDIVGVIAAGEG